MCHQIIITGPKEEVRHRHKPPPCRGFCLIFPKGRQTYFIRVLPNKHRIYRRNIMVIGLSGVAGCGKDTFFNVLSESMSVKRVSLADSLKNEVNDWTLRHYGIDAMTCSRKDKEKIRPFLVYHGGMKRDKSNGRHWIEQTEWNLTRNHPDYTTVITDIRFDEYENDEVGWLKNELNGILVHVSQYEIKEVVSRKEWPRIEKEKVFKSPANEEEARNDPKIKSQADYVFEAERIDGTEIHIKNMLRPKIEEFVEWIRGA